MKAVRMHEYGGPEVLKYEEAPRPEPVSGMTPGPHHAAYLDGSDNRLDLVGLDRVGEVLVRLEVQHAQGEVLDDGTPITRLVKVPKGSEQLDQHD